MDNFDLRKYLTENKLTSNSRTVKEEEAKKGKKLTLNDFIQMVRDDMMAGAAPDEYPSDEQVRRRAESYYNDYLQGASVDDLFEAPINGVVDVKTKKFVGTFQYGKGFKANEIGKELGYKDHPTSIPNGTKMEKREKFSNEEAKPGDPDYMEIYKNWEIRKSDYAPGYYEATSLNDSDAFMKYAKSIEQIKIEIDEEE